MMDEVISQTRAVKLMKVSAPTVKGHAYQVHTKEGVVTSLDFFTAYSDYLDGIGWVDVQPDMGERRKR